MGMMLLVAGGLGLLALGITFGAAIYLDVRAERRRERSCVLLRCMSPFMAQNGRPNPRDECLLLEEEQTSPDRISPRH
jgi:hypothetical protein